MNAPFDESSLVNPPVYKMNDYNEGKLMILKAIANTVLKACLVCCQKT
jgi:hypothetical protein